MSILNQILGAIQGATMTPEAAQAATQMLLQGAAPQQAPTPTGEALVTPPHPMSDASSMSVQPPHVEAPPRRLGILDTIGHVVSPEPGSFWHSALNGGLVNARETQQQYPLKLQAAADARDRGAIDNRLHTAQASEAEAKAARDRLGQTVTPTGTVLGPPGPDGKPTVLYEPPVRPSESERLIDAWQRASAAGNGPLAALLERAIKGYDHSQDYIDADTARRVAVARARPHGSGRGGGGGATKRPPAGTTEF